MRLVFLDIDGVLNSNKWINVRADALKKVEDDIMAGGDGLTQAKLVFYDNYMIDPEAIEVLNTIIDRSKAAIVITSTWRVDRPIQAIATAFRRRGFKHSHAIIGCTPEIPDKKRGAEIQAWLDHVDGVEAFVVIDDDFIAEFEDHQVRTDFNHGLTPDHVGLVLEMLGVT